MYSKGYGKAAKHPKPYPDLFIKIEIASNHSEIFLFYRQKSLLHYTIGLLHRSKEVKKDLNPVWRETCQILLDELTVAFKIQVLYT